MHPEGRTTMGSGVSSVGSQGTSDSLIDKGQLGGLHFDMPQATRRNSATLGLLHSSYLAIS